MSTHQELLYHITFSTKNRKRYLQNDCFREEVFAYMAGICRQLNGFPLIVGGYFDHAHLLVRIPARIAVAKFVGEVKANSSKRINETSGRIHKFGWQDGYGAFTVSVSKKDAVYRYIENQVQHHSHEDFRQEYLRLLDRHEVEYNPEYVFE